jgi:hypothetical protein
MRSALSPRFKIKDVAVDREALQKARINFTPGALNGPIPGLPVAQDIDLYVVILKHNPPQNSPVCMGLGVHADHGLLRTGASSYACYDFVLVDPKTGKIIYAALGQLSPKWPMALPMQSADGDMVPKPPATPTPEQSARLRQEMISYLDDSIPEMMLRHNLTDRSIHYIPGVPQDNDIKGIAVPPETVTAAPPPPSQ